ncbi:MAG TPA: PIN domain-containing protein [Acidobacteriaceae bacterium]|nr:PIN domain-containing protein [Acidobacteriaceae bacterium]
MTLADTAIWIDYFRGRNPDMRPLIEKAQIAIHPCIVAELALGSLHDRHNTLRELEILAGVVVASLGELRRMTEAHALYSKGIGLTDAHLLASCLLTPGLRLWTRDKPLQNISRTLGIHANLP